MSPPLVYLSQAYSSLEDLYKRLQTNEPTLPNIPDSNQFQNDEAIDALQNRLDLSKQRVIELTKVLQFRGRWTTWLRESPENKLTDLIRSKTSASDADLRSLWIYLTLAERYETSSELIHAERMAAGAAGQDLEMIRLTPYELSFFAPSALEAMKVDFFRAIKPNNNAREIALNFPGPPVDLNPNVHLIPWAQIVFVPLPKKPNTYVAVIYLSRRLPPGYSISLTQPNREAIALPYYPASPNAISLANLSNFPILLRGTVIQYQSPDGEVAVQYLGSDRLSIPADPKDFIIIDLSMSPARYRSTWFKTILDFENGPLSSVLWEYPDKRKEVAKLYLETLSPEERKQLHDAATVESKSFSDWLTQTPRVYIQFLQLNADLANIVDLKIILSPEVIERIRIVITELNALNHLRSHNLNSIVEEVLTLQNTWLQTLDRLTQQSLTPENAAEIASAYGKIYLQNGGKEFERRYLTDPNRTPGEIKNYFHKVFPELGSTEPAYQGQLILEALRLKGAEPALVKQLEFFEKISKENPLLLTDPNAARWFLIARYYHDRSHVDPSHPQQPSTVESLEALAVIDEYMRQDQDTKERRATFDALTENIHKEIQAERERDRIEEDAKRRRMIR